jgi:ABC-type multidrug transport system ATPase subunit
VKENLQFYATVFGTSISENYDLIKDIYSHIEPFEDRLAGRLSGGMKQKLALSCALIHRPKVLVLDEPTTGVDAVSRKEFWDMLKKIRHEGITVLVSTPYMDEAAQCDRVGLMQKGKLLSISAPDELSLKENTSVYRFTTSANVYEYLEKFRAIGNALSAWLFGDEIHVFLSADADRNKIRREIETWKVPGLEWHEMQAGVEDYFMQLMTEEEQDEC